MPVNESRVFPYGVYRRIWNVVPLRYDSLFPARADLTVFFNYIVPPRLRGKVITTIHDMTYLRFPETMDARNRRRLEEGLARSVARSDRLLTVSEFSKREIMELLHIPAEKIRVVYSAPGFSETAAPPEALSVKYGIRGPYLLYVGTIEPRKNLVRLIRAYELLRAEGGVSHQLVLAGGSGWQNAEILQAARDSRYSEDIRFTGYLSEAEKNGLYRGADLFVFPSLYEGFGMPPLEAMHWGCPVLVSRAASLPEVVGDAAETADPLDEADIAAGIRRVLSDPAYANTLREKGYAQTRAFSWEDSARRLDAACREVLEE